MTSTVMLMPVALAKMLSLEENGGEKNLTPKKQCKRPALPPLLPSRIGCARQLVSLLGFVLYLSKTIDKTALLRKAQSKYKNQVKI